MGTQTPIQSPLRRNCETIMGSGRHVFCDADLQLIVQIGRAAGRWILGRAEQHRLAQCSHPSGEIFRVTTESTPIPVEERARFHEVDVLSD
eukprot:m.175322 g.175322  ORF g.175322 m.175322 type:complete len:91 (+) comp24404_c0_seq2:256-528(+)